MIDFAKSVEARQRQSTVWVGDVEYNIRTAFFHWLNFRKIHEELDREGVKEFDPSLFDWLYVSGIPDDKVAGYRELEKFYVNEQPLPNDTGKQGNVIALDYSIDSERIYAAFKKEYGVDLLSTDLHWHCFQSLFNSLFWDLGKVVEARLYKEKPDKFEKLCGENRTMWKITPPESKKEIFKMR